MYIFDNGEAPVLPYSWIFGKAFTNQKKERTFICVGDQRLALLHDDNDKKLIIERNKSPV